jgi:DNA-binding transcriptional ArsR family regulator
MKIKVKKKGGGEKSGKEKYKEIYQQMLREPASERSDGMDKIYSAEDLKRYDDFLSRFTDPLQGMREYHRVYAGIYNDPARREILKTLISGEKTVDDIQKTTKMSPDEVNRHLNMLDFCVEPIEREGGVYYKLTKEGERIKIQFEENSTSTNSKR